MARGEHGCRDCKRCNSSAMRTKSREKMASGLDRITFGLSNAVRGMRKTCGVCGHPLTAHERDLVGDSGTDTIVSTATATSNDLGHQLAELARLRDDGSLTDDEFDAAKSKLLGD